MTRYIILRTCEYIVHWKCSATEAFQLDSLRLIFYRYAVITNRYLTADNEWGNTVGTNTLNINKETTRAVGEVKIWHILKCIYKYNTKLKGLVLYHECIVWNCNIWLIDFLPAHSVNIHVMCYPWVYCKPRWRHGSLARYVKMRVVHAPGMPGTFSPPAQVSDAGMHHGTSVTHVPWCMPASLTGGFLWSRRGVGGNLPGIPGACATRNFTYLVRGPWHWNYFRITGSVWGDSSGLWDTILIQIPVVHSFDIFVVIDVTVIMIQYLYTPLKWLMDQSFCFPEIKGSVMKILQVWEMFWMQ